MTFREGNDFRELVDPTVCYLLRLDRIEDRETKIGESLAWFFQIHDRETGAPILKSDGNTLVVSRMTSPATGPRTRTRRFIHALLGQELSKAQLRALIESGSLASKLRDRKALAFLEFEQANDGNEYLRVNELLPLDSNGASPEPPANTPRSYSEVFPEDDDSKKDLPF